MSIDFYLLPFITLFHLCLLQAFTWITQFLSESAYLTKHENIVSLAYHTKTNCNLLISAVTDRIPQIDQQ